MVLDARQQDVTDAVYMRPMPGGGYVRVEMLVSQPGDIARERMRGRVVLERRLPAPATPDQEPVIVEEVEGSDANAVVAELFRIARDNAAIARRVLRRHGAAFRAD
ncbi:MAG: hypothetical protein ABIY52_03960 [Gemmatimonadaceae bacterium]